jgi:hypothetical protein
VSESTNDYGIPSFRTRTVPWEVLVLEMFAIFEYEFCLTAIPIDEGIWVAQVDPGAVRATNDVDALIRPENLEQVKQVMADNGYHYRKAAG